MGYLSRRSDYSVPGYYSEIVEADTGPVDVPVAPVGDSFVVRANVHWKQDLVSIAAAGRETTGRDCSMDSDRQC